MSCGPRVSGKTIVDNIPGMQVKSPRGDAKGPKGWATTRAERDVTSSGGKQQTALMEMSVRTGGRA